MKRYAIVRVDNMCPEYIEDFKCHFPDNSVECMTCNHHRYGDTKEQLIRKVATAIKRKLKGGYSVTYRKFGKGYIKDGVSARELAESIVEFLGVE